jgi:Arc/MetJ-type ribon-helix-helix transcriptional regulator
LGKRSIDLILINTVAPFLVAYGRYKGDSDFMERALELLQKVAPEKNSMIKQWNDLKVKAKNALDSQALLQLKKQYCDKKRCLECHFGHQLLQQKKPAAAISKKARTVMIMSNK